MIKQGQKVRSLVSLIYPNEGAQALDSNHILTLILFKKLSVNAVNMLFYQKTNFFFPQWPNFQRRWQEIF
jgi:hypothetical protein